jgi:hypothetical protein
MPQTDQMQRRPISYAEPRDCILVWM